jgi:hypothetical protein
MTTLSDEVTDVAVPGAPADTTEALAERLFLATIDFLEIASIHVGRKLGYYAELATSGPATAAELARRTGTATRYAQEWLEQQTTAGFLGTDDPEADPAARTYHLPETHRPVFVDAEDLNLVAPLATLAVGVLRPWTHLSRPTATAPACPSRHTARTWSKGSARSTGRSSSTRWPAG